MQQPPDIRKVAFLGDYLPRKCVIATFTTDLRCAVAKEFPALQCLVVPVNDTAEGYNYPAEVRFEITEQDLPSYLRAADFLNITDVDVVCVEHEFGIFGGPAGKATAILNLATAAVTDPAAAGRGVTAARIATLTAAIAAFTNVMNTPRGQIVNKSALLREVETDTAALVQLVTDMDDLALQFTGSDAANRFQEAWKRARFIVDTGGGHGSTPPTPTPAAPGK